MRRREVIALFGSAAAWTAAARAQTAQKIPRVGILDLAPTNSEPGLRRGLRELGYVEGQRRRATPMVARSDCRNSPPSCFA